MTRAAERLIVCGTQGARKIPDVCWYQLVEDALKPDCVSEPADDGIGEVLRYRKGAVSTSESVTANIAATKPMPLPAWLTCAAAPEPAAARSITPSSVMD